MWNILIENLKMHCGLHCRSVKPNVIIWYVRFCLDIKYREQENNDPLDSYLPALYVVEIVSSVEKVSMI